MVREDSLHCGDRAESILLKRRDGLVVSPQQILELFVSAWNAGYVDVETGQWYLFQSMVNCFFGDYVNNSIV